jgi:hypothetical protein
MGGLVGGADHYKEFIELARQRIEALGVPYTTVDNICGFPERYTAKIICGSKACSVFSLFILAKALALQPLFFHDADELLRLQSYRDWVPRRAKKRRPSLAEGTATRFINYRDFYQQIGRKGGLVRSALRKKRRAQTAAATAARWARRAEPGR